ncbi:hypothetical protein RCL1_005414 [Eukaryota sp. TZLM3-RCL]
MHFSDLLNLLKDEELVISDTLLLDNIASSLSELNSTSVIDFDVSLFQSLVHLTSFKSLQLPLSTSHLNCLEQFFTLLKNFSESCCNFSLLIYHSRRVIEFALLSIHLNACLNESNLLSFISCFIYPHLPYPQRLLLLPAFITICSCFNCKNNETSECFELFQKIINDYSICLADVIIAIENSVDRSFISSRHLLGFLHVLSFLQVTYSLSLQKQASVLVVKLFTKFLNSWNNSEERSCEEVEILIKKFVPTLEILIRNNSATVVSLLPLLFNSLCTFFLKFNLFFEQIISPLFISFINSAFEISQLVLDFVSDNNFSLFLVAKFLTKFSSFWPPCLESAIIRQSFLIKLASFIELNLISDNNSFKDVLNLSLIPFSEISICFQEDFVGFFTSLDFTDLFFFFNSNSFSNIDQVKIVVQGIYLIFGLNNFVSHNVILDLFFHMISHSFPLVFINTVLKLIENRFSEVGVSVLNCERIINSLFSIHISESESSAAINSFLKILISLTSKLLHFYPELKSQSAIMFETWYSKKNEKVNICDEILVVLFTQFHQS